MALKTSRISAIALATAALSVAATPAGARGWDRYDRDRIDAGDVIGGILVLGTIAAIASAARGSRDRYDERYPGGPYRGDAGRYATPGQYDRGQSSGIDRAVDMCVGEVERSRGRVGSVDSAVRDRNGWAVSGELAGGERFSCRIGNDGRISDVNLGTFGYGTAPAERVEDRQYSDDVYAAARARQGGDVGGDGPPPLPESDPYAASATRDFDQGEEL